MKAINNAKATDTDTVPARVTNTDTISGLQLWTQCQGYRHNARATDTGLQTQ